MIKCEAGGYPITIRGDGVGWLWRVCVEADMQRNGWEWGEEQARDQAIKWIAWWEKERLTTLASIGIAQANTLISR